jgi:hypothetical protein
MKNTLLMGGKCHSDKVFGAAEVFAEAPRTDSGAALRAVWYQLQVLPTDRSREEERCEAFDAGAGSQSLRDRSLSASLT